MLKTVFYIDSIVEKENDPGIDGQMSFFHDRTLKYQVCMEGNGPWRGYCESVWDNYNNSLSPDDLDYIIAYIQNMEAGESRDYAMKFIGCVERIREKHGDDAELLFELW